MLQELQKEIEEFNERKEEIVNKVKEELPKIIGEMIKDVPEINSVHWVQYIPTFNDGDACEFTIGEVEINRNEDGENEKMYESTWYHWGVKYIDREGEKEYTREKLIAKGVDIEKSLLFVKIVELIESLDIFLEEAYGQFADISIDKEGAIKIEEYYYKY